VGGRASCHPGYRSKGSARSAHDKICCGARARLGRGMEERFPGFLGTGGGHVRWVGSNEMRKAPGWSFFLSWDTPCSHLQCPETNPTMAPGLDVPKTHETKQPLRSEEKRLGAGVLESGPSHPCAHGPKPDRGGLLGLLQGCASAGIECTSHTQRHGPYLQRMYKYSCFVQSTDTQLLMIMTSVRSTVYMYICFL
jgi:hypothetical protein